MSLRIGSMFAGYSGLEMGVMQVLDAQPVWFAEIDEAPARILHHHYPDVLNLGDVTKVDWGSVPPIDILTAGYPCQPFSQAGHRKGTNDERHLWPYVYEAIKHLRPRIAFFENVRGHLTLGLAEVLEDLASIGWDAQWACVRASDVGAPHHRERLFILAYPDCERPQAGGLARRPAQEITWDNDLYDTLAGLNRAPDISHEMKLCWGDTAPAILTWAMLTNQNPPPIVIDHEDKALHPRFPETRAATNPEFIEWMMGLPAGWVTDVPGLTRNQQLKALGNGVVPAQAAYALNHLLNL
ncbi:DNA (cytosine-5-)-methyltransferase [Corynebacterium tuberculostearicum]|uniref:DNA cytosine methyltransferase n=1 Tax=Corynebacterium tuberculostearicum TaxID=38304 RepID=UPI00266570B4|nr:DNA (cytosine-5-)-methyltransferase [Corynebacterium tuberculostearicum]WKE50359.1 DNA (cytosine-5-)-methyltransferase [Corynebacterium tuberculostearicum]